MGHTRGGRATRLGDVLRLRSHGERGAVLITTAFSLVALLGTSALVIDIGNASQRGRSA